MNAPIINVENFSTPIGVGKEEKHHPQPITPEKEKDMVELKIADSVSNLSKITWQRLKSTGPAASAALSFGTTYSVIFSEWKKYLSTELLSKALSRQEGCSDLPSFFPVDERLVPFGDPASNWGSASRLFLSYCGRPNDLGRHPKNVKNFKKILSDYFQGPPLFDITFLGIGGDGHTASLFPGSCPDFGSQEWNAPVLRTTAPFAPTERLSLGPEVIAESKQLVICVTGKSKAEILETVLLQTNEKKHKTENLPPVKIIRRREALGLDTLVIADREAAERSTGIKTGLSG